MGRPTKSEERRKELLPLVAQAFSELGYRRATTAELAARCGVQENVLYRLWTDKKAMFVASIDHLFQRRMEKWSTVLGGAKASQRDRRERLIELTGDSLGEHGLYRIIFAALSETDDEDVRRSLQRLYRRYHDRILEEISPSNGAQEDGAAQADQTAWALIGLVAFMNIAVDLDLMNSNRRKEFFVSTALRLLANPS